MQVLSEAVVLTHISYYQWGAMVDNRVHRSKDLQKLTKYLANPEAKIGVVAAIRYSTFMGIGRSGYRTSTAVFVDIENGNLHEVQNVDPDHHWEAKKHTISYVPQANCWIYGKQWEQDLGIIVKDYIKANRLNTWTKKIRKGNIC